MSTDSAAPIVTALLSAARLTVSAEEKDQMIKDFPAIRSAADGLYLAELDGTEPAVRFDPSSYYRG